jgi:hypothetical protein
MAVSTRRYMTEDELDRRHDRKKQAELTKARRAFYSQFYCVQAGEQFETEVVVTTWERLPAHIKPQIATARDASWYLYMSERLADCRR